jgi:hypothetical protein
MFMSKKHSFSRFFAAVMYILSLLISGSFLFLQYRYLVFLALKKFSQFWNFSLLPAFRSGPVERFVL